MKLDIQEPLVTLVSLWYILLSRTFMYTHCTINSLILGSTPSYILPSLPEYTSNEPTVRAHDWPWRQRSTCPLPRHLSVLYGWEDGDAHPTRPWGDYRGWWVPGGGKFYTGMYLLQLQVVSIYAHWYWYVFIPISFKGRNHVRIKSKLFIFRTFPTTGTWDKLKPLLIGAQHVGSSLSTSVASQDSSIPRVSLGAHNL
jgi:hypothetical protein